MKHTRGAPYSSAKLKGKNRALASDTQEPHSAGKTYFLPGDLPKRIVAASWATTTISATMKSLEKPDPGRWFTPAAGRPFLLGTSRKSKGGP